jgi:hypothetical protein
VNQPGPGAVPAGGDGIEEETMQATTEHRARRWAAAVAVIAGLTGALTAVPAAPVAADVPDHEIVSQPSALNSNITRSTTAECPFGKELVGSGGSVNGGGDVLLESIVPDLVTESVTVSGRETPAGTTADWSLRAVAVCADEGSVPGRYIVDDVDSSIPGLPAAAALADCDPGDRALSVGFQFYGAPGRLHLTTLMPTLDSMLAVGQEDAAGTAAAWDVRVIGLCAPLSDTQVYWDESAGFSTAGPKSALSVCPTDFDVTSGGGFVFDESGATGDLTLVSVKPATYLSTDFGSAQSLEATPTAADSSLYAYVVCLDLR